MKKIILFLLILPSIAFAELIKLSCNINLVTDNVLKETTNINEVLEIYLSDKLKSISPMSDNLWSISTRKDVNRTSDDYSDENKIHLEVTQTLNNSSLDGRTTKFIIDRNTGKLFYNNTSFFKNGHIISTTGDGTCEKVNVAKKKF